MKFILKNKIQYGKQYIDKTDYKLVIKSLKEELITTGKFVKIFEDQIRRQVKSKYACSCVNGTAGLHLAYLSIGLSQNDVIIMPAINFIAAYRLAELMGAKIYLADVNSVSGQMTPSTLMNCIKKNKLKKIKVILTMQLGGYSINNLEFYKIKKKYKCYLIEDACHAFGSKYRVNKKLHPVGSCKHSDLSVFSFHPVKPITTGEGGAITTNNHKLAKKIFLLRSHGIIRKKSYWDYNINELGFNYRLSDINCALGVSQIKKLSQFINKRKKILNIYKKNFLSYSQFITIFDVLKNLNSYHLILMNIDFKKIKSSKKKLINFLNEKKIFPQFHYKPIYRFSFFKKKYSNKFLGAENYYKNTISLPIYHTLSKDTQFYIIKNIFNYIKKNIK